jgi:hypothetical protein
VRLCAAAVRAALSAVRENRGEAAGYPAPAPRPGREAGPPAAVGDRGGGRGGGDTDGDLAGAAAGAEPLRWSGRGRELHHFRRGRQNESAPAAPVAGQGQTGGDAGTTPAGGGSSQQSAGTTYDGSWSGTTSEGNAISFSVSNGVITRLVVAITKQTAAASYTDTTSMWFTDPRQAPKISGSSFQAEGRGTSTTGDSSTRWTLSGSFSTPTSASGSIAARFVQGPTETVVGTSSVSWTASQG